MNDILHQILYRRSEALKAKIKINQLRLNKWKLIDLASKLDYLLDDRFDPELCLSVRRDDMNMNSRLFSGEEIKPVTPYSYNRRTHNIYYIKKRQFCQYRKK